MGIMKLIFLTNLLLLLRIPLHSASTYNVGDLVPLFVSKIGPLHNPSETYKYYELPFCRPDQVLEKKESLRELLNGDRLTSTPYELEFAVYKTEEVLCQINLNQTEIMKFKNAIENDFYYKMYFDDLPMWAFIGKIENTDINKPKYFLFTHVDFNALYSENQVIEIRAFSNPSHVVDVTEDVEVEVEFTYSIFWSKTDTPYKNRMDRYFEASSVLQKTHWFSFVNSIVIVILLMGFLTVVFTRHLKNDLRKWSIGDGDEEKDIGWKYIHLDVFRCPLYLPLFSAFLGCGTQLLTMLPVLFVLATTGFFKPYNRASLSNFLIAYVLTSPVAGYISASFCNQYAETGWKRSAFLAGILFFGPFITIAFLTSMLVGFFGAISTIHLGTTIIILFLFAIPLLFLGGFMGHRYKSDIQSSPLTKKFPKAISSLSWYRKTPIQMLIGGLLPFSAIVLELHNLCSTIWGYKIYTSPGVLFVMFLILVIITAMLSVGLTYFQLAVEDHEWRWRSVLRGGSTAIFMFCYCIYFYFKSNMRGIVQRSLYFGYSALMCYAFFLMLGTVSSQASLLFLRRIHGAVKSE